VDILHHTIPETMVAGPINTRRNSERRGKSYACLEIQFPHPFFFLLSLKSRRSPTACSFRTGPIRKITFTFFVLA